MTIQRWRCEFQRTEPECSCTRRPGLSASSGEKRESLPFNFPSFSQRASSFDATGVEFFHTHSRLGSVFVGSASDAMHDHDSYFAGSITSASVADTRTFRTGPPE